MPTDVIDISNDRVRHDLTVEENIARVEHDITDGVYDAVGLAPVCSSLSRRLHPKVRDALHLWGLPPERLPGRVGRRTGVEYLDYHNTMLRAFFRLLRAAVNAPPRNGRKVGIWAENPADAQPRITPGSLTRNRFYDKRAKNSASLFRFPEFAAIVSQAGGRFYHIIQCPLGSRFWKPTTIWATEDVGSAIAPFEAYPCKCPPGTHLQASGRDHEGRSLSRQSQEYGPGLYYGLAVGMLRAADARHGGRRVRVPHEASARLSSDSSTDDDALPRHHDSASDGEDDEIPSLVGPPDDDGAAGASHTATPAPEIAYGPRLPPLVHGLVQEARSHPPRWASHRRLHAASQPEAIAAPYCEVQPTRTTSPARRRQAGQPYATGHFPPPSLSSRPAAPIAIADLFLPGKYELVVAWLAEAHDAMEAMAAGEYRRVPTLVLGQDALQPWARGVIWDCRDAANCVLCEPSGEDFQPPGDHLMNRAVFRAMAQSNGITDAGTISTAGHGGVESTSTTTLDIVLSFHHAGFGAQFEAGARVIDADIEAEFVSAPWQWLPYVPTKLGPRNVMMQTRSRIIEGGDVQEYEKPRVTFDLSDGSKAVPEGADATPRTVDHRPLSVNAGVHADRKTVSLPSRRWASASVWASPKSPPSKPPCHSASRPSTRPTRTRT